MTGIRRHAVVRGDNLTYFAENGQLVTIPLKSAAWEEWLDSHSKFRYDDELGGFIARAEPRGFYYYRDPSGLIVKSRKPIEDPRLEFVQKLQWYYWYAYRRTSVGVIKAYLGASFNAPYARTHPTAEQLRQTSLRIAEKEQRKASVSP